MAKRLRVDGRKTNTRLDAKQIKDLEVSFRRGETLRAAAQTVGCSPGTVYLWYQKFKEKQTTT
jgi:transposase